MKLTIYWVYHEYHEYVIHGFQEYTKVQPHTCSISQSVFVNTVQATSRVSETTVTEESVKETVEDGTTAAAVAVPIIIFIAVIVVVNVYVVRRRTRHRYIPLL